MKENNFNAVRLVAAGLVLYGHAYIFLGFPAPLFLSWMPLGPVGVYIFFAISGYLVTESWQRDPHCGRFLARRALRILPGLAVCVLLCIFILGPALTSQPLKEYFESNVTWGYLRNVLLYICYPLPGVFESSRLPYAVNGSLWSLPVEACMYIGVALLGLMRGNRWIYLLLAVMSAVATVVWNVLAPTRMVVVYAFDLRQVFNCGTYFWVGACLFAFGARRYFTLSATVLASVTLLSLERWPILLQYASWLLLPFIVLAFGLAHSPALTWLTRRGDYSYGIYIYAFPVQQTILVLFPAITFGWNLLLCSVVTLTCAAASWHFVERRALNLKPRAPARQPASHSAALPATLP